ncbi:N-acetyltransferase family protein [Nocardioides sp.]|uniref:GNAT family N-acetyltransferase n=1 Tax=Nocardioides sp. TaxID=35761 RepID=UPI003D0BC74B
MNRSPVQLRSVVEDDASQLAELWADILRRADALDQVEDIRRLIKQVQADPDERIVVAEYDGQLAGAIFLRLATITPINLEPVVQAVSPHVFPQFRRHGVGRALMDAAVCYAEELGIGHVASGSVSTSRDGNRFLARLGLGPQVILRVAPTHAVRAKLMAQRPSARGSRQLDRVLASRRVLRRERATG